MKQVKTRKEKLIEAGLPINYCEIKVEFPRKPSVLLEMVYKQIKFKHIEDKYLVGRVRSTLGMNDKDKIKDIKVNRVIKSMGNGVYEE